MYFWLDKHRVRTMPIMIYKTYIYGIYFICYTSEGTVYGIRG